MTITEASFSDLEFILELQKECYVQEAEIYSDYTIPPLTQTLESIREDFATHIFLKATAANTIIGSVKAFHDQDTCYVGRLIVKKEMQNQGIGKQLMQCIEGRFHQAKRFELFTGSQSVKNILLYKRLGYNAFKTQKINDQLEMIFLEKSVGVQV